MTGPASHLFAVILPVFALICLGWLARRTRFVEAGGTKGLVDLVYWVVLPSLLFLSVQRQSAPDGVFVAAMYFAVILPGFGLAVLAARTILKARLSHAAVFALNAVFGNTLLMGAPIVDAVWGEQGLAALIAIIAFHSITLLPLATLLIELDKERETGLVRFLGGTMLGILRNPIISSILLAYLWRATGIPLPEGVRRLLELLAQAAPALSLICLGASLPEVGRSSTWNEALLATAIKLVAMPLCMAILVRAIGMPSPAGPVMVLASALPTGANAFMLARRTGALIDASAATVALGTAASIATLWVVLLLLQ